MGIDVYQSRSVEKQLLALSRGGGNAAQAAAHARAIMREFARRKNCSPRETGRLTRNGDARIKNCVKFDLVWGYRLVGLLGAGEILFLFVGSHDECDHWIRNNAGLDHEWEKKKCRLAPSLTTSEANSDDADSQDENADSCDECDIEKAEEGYDYRASLEISERDLRKIFSGICGRKGGRA